MVFNIYNDDRCSPLIDVENYFKYNEYDKKYHQSISVTICADGFCNYLMKYKNFFSDDNTLKSFISSVEHIQNLNFILHEYWCHESDYPKNSEEKYCGDEAYYVDNKIRKELEIFCAYWNMNINED